MSGGGDMVERVARAIWAARIQRCRDLGAPEDTIPWPWEQENETLHENVRVEARAAIEAMDGWSADFSEAPHDTSLWVYATDDQGYAYGPASIWDSGNPNGPELVWNYDQKHRPINNGIERALLWHLVPQFPGQEKLQAALRSSLTGDSK